LTTTAQQVILFASTTNREVKMKIGTLIKIKNTSVIGIVVAIDNEGRLDVRGLNGIWLDRRYTIRETNKYVEVLCR